MAVVTGDTHFPIDSGKLFASGRWLRFIGIITIRSKGEHS